MLITILQKPRERTLPNSYEASITPKLKPDKDTKKEENCRPIFLRNTDIKILNKALENLTTHWKDHIPYPVGFIYLQIWCSICTCNTAHK